MRLSDLTEATADTLRSAGAILLDLMTPTLRLGVTGLARSGKTVFITALVRSLVAGGRLPFFAAMAEGRIARAYLEPQPDDRVPRFAYEEHLADARRATRRSGPRARGASASCASPSSTRHTTALRRALGPGRLHVDIVDYPGEWLLDLPLLELSFADWSSRRGRGRARTAPGRGRQGLAGIPLHARSRRARPTSRPRSPAPASSPATCRPRARPTPS